MRDGGTYVLYPDGSSKPVTNLGWLLAHWRSVNRFDVSRITDPRGYPEARMVATLKDGRQFITDWASASVCRQWLHRPVFRTCPMRWFGVDTVC
jgi:hypothetical protein